MTFGVVVHSFTEPPFIIYFHSRVAFGQIKKARMNFQNLNRQWCLQVVQTKIHSRYVWAKSPIKTKSQYISPKAKEHKGSNTYWLHTKITTCAMWNNHELSLRTRTKNQLQKNYITIYGVCQVVFNNILLYLIRKNENASEDFEFVFSVMVLVLFRVARVNRSRSK